MKNVLVTGATGSGKSSTINALAGKEIAKVGVEVDPESRGMEKYQLDKLILWSTPGLGDGKEKDIEHSKNILDKLCELDENGNPLIDLVLVVLDASSRDLGTSYHLINSVLAPSLGEHPEKRLLVGINQCDLAMKGRNWDDEKHEPEPVLVEFLEDKLLSVQKRIKEGTGLDISAVYYSAGFKEDDEEQSPSYRVDVLLEYLLKMEESTSSRKQDTSSPEEETGNWWERLKSRRKRKNARKRERVRSFKQSPKKDD